MFIVLGHKVEEKKGHRKENKLEKEMIFKLLVDKKKWYEKKDKYFLSLLFSRAKFEKKKMCIK